jgi:hypothetical protein
MIRLIALAFGLALAQPVFAQPAPPPAAPAGKPAATKPAVTQPSVAAKAAAKPTAAAATSGPCIGVISALGDSFGVQKIGLTVFGNEYKEISVPAWGLDDLVVARVRAAAGPRVSVKRIGYAKGAFEPYEHAKTLLHDSEADLAAVVKTIAAAGGCARYLVVVRFSTSFSNTNQTIKGIGAVNYGYSFSNRTYVFAITGIRLYDGRDFALLKKGIGGRSSQDGPFLYFNSFVRGPNRELKDFEWPDNKPEAVVAAARDTARAVLSESLDRALPDLLAP